MRGAVLSISSGECLEGAVKCSNAYEPVFYWPWGDTDDKNFPHWPCRDDN